MEGCILTDTWSNISVDNELYKLDRSVVCYRPEVHLNYINCAKILSKFIDRTVSNC